MISRKTLPVWIGVTLLSGIFLMGQEGWGPTPCEVVSFPDPNLEQVIREEIGKPTGEICAYDLLGLYDLDEPDRSIVDLTGLEFCTDLFALFINDNQISDIGPLAGLKDLNYLGLDSNLISDISPLAELTNLKGLFLHDNQIGDISPLAGLSGLSELWLEYNQIRDISPLAGLTGLWKLHLDNNQITDISALTGMINLSWLHLDNNRISDVLPLVDNTGIGNGDNVYLNGNPLSSTSCATHIPTLESRGVYVSHGCP